MGDDDQVPSAPLAGDITGQEFVSTWSDWTPREQLQFAHDRLAANIMAQVDAALRDPKVIATALMRLPPEARNTVRVLLDQLESVGYAPEE